MSYASSESYVKKKKQAKNLHIRRSLHAPIMQHTYICKKVHSRRSVVHCRHRHGIFYNSPVPTVRILVNFYLIYNQMNVNLAKIKVSYSLSGNNNNNKQYYVYVCAYMKYQQIQSKGRKNHSFNFVFLFFHAHDTGLNWLPPQSTSNSYQTMLYLCLWLKHNRNQLRNFSIKVKKISNKEEMLIGC